MLIHTYKQSLFLVHDTLEIIVEMAAFRNFCCKFVISRIIFDTVCHIRKNNQSATLVNVTHTMIIKW